MLLLMTHWSLVFLSTADGGIGDDISWYCYQLLMEVCSDTLVLLSTADGGIFDALVLVSTADGGIDDVLESGIAIYC